MRWVRRVRAGRRGGLLVGRDALDLDLRRHFGDDGPDPAHSARHDRRPRLQRHLDAAAAVALRLDHHDQKAALPARHPAVQQRRLPHLCRGLYDAQHQVHLERHVLPRAHGHHQAEPQGPRLPARRQPQ